MSPTALSITNSTLSVPAATVGVSFADPDHAAELMENSPSGTLVKAVTLINLPDAASDGDLRCDVTAGDDTGGCGITP